MQRRSAPPIDRAPAPAHRSYFWPAIAFGVGASGIAVGTIFGVRTFRDSSDLAGACPDQQCPPGYQDHIDTAQRDALVADIGFAVGALGAGAGTYLLLSSAPARKSATIEPWIGAGSVGARGRF